MTGVKIPTKNALISHAVKKKISNPSIGRFTRDNDILEPRRIVAATAKIKAIAMTNKNVRFIINPY